MHEQMGCSITVVSSSPQLYWPEMSHSDNNVPRPVKFLFGNPIRCRIIWITLTLAQPGSASFNLAVS